MIDLPPPLHPRAALEEIASSRYSFAWVYVGISEKDLTAFREIAIEKNLDFNQFGEFNRLKDAVAAFLSSIGPNPPCAIEQTASCIRRIVSEIMEASGKETAWIALRASVPLHKYDTPRWHFDPHYYLLSREDDRIHYKFVVTLLGPSTLFSPIPRESSELRSHLFENHWNRVLLAEICSLAPVMSPPTGIGAYFLRGTERIAAVHSEPKCDQSRLFLSIVPCNENEIGGIRSMVDIFYRDGRVSLNDP